MFKKILFALGAALVALIAVLLILHLFGAWPESSMLLEVMVL